VKLSVILITWNSEKDVKSCIDSVLEATVNLEHEILVVDNGSADATINILRTFGNKIRLFQNSQNRGVAKARNRALKEAQGDLFWILDIDTIVNRDALEAMIEHLENHHSTGICACKLISQQGEVQDSCRKLPTLRFKLMNAMLAIFNKIRFFSGLKNFFEQLTEQQFYHQEINGQLPFEVGYVIGACQLFHREILEKVGFLDENIFYGPEDADFCLRIRENGGKVMFLPYTFIVHHYMRITTKRLFSRMSLVHFWAVLYFSWKHKRF
jgi:GT2 family glycosyltransferase